MKQGGNANLTDKEIEEVKVANIERSAQQEIAAAQTSSVPPSQKVEVEQVKEDEIVEETAKLSVEDVVIEGDCNSTLDLSSIILSR